MKKEQSHTNRGFSLVELLISMSIFLIFVSAVYSVSIGTIVQGETSVNRERAIHLSEEGIEASRNIRDANFANLVDGTYGLQINNGVWSYVGSDDSTGIFTREVKISTVNENEKQIEVIVDWSDRVSDSNSVSLVSSLTNWRNIISSSGLTVFKNVINHGGSATPADFAPYEVETTVGTSTVTSLVLGESQVLTPGTYIVSENNNSDYTQTFSGDCDGSGQVVLAPGDVKVCTITNEEKPSYLKVVKNVINYSLSKTINDFTLSVDGAPVTSGDTNVFTSGTHIVSEVNDPQYTMAFSGDCDNSGLVTLNPQQTKTCTITNEQIRFAPTITTTALSSVNLSSAISGGNITDNGGAAVTSRGVVWSTTTNPTIVLTTKTTDGTGSGVFSSSISGLSSGTNYYVRAYAINAIGTSYGSNILFTTQSLPVVSNPASNSITTNTAILSASITSSGNPSTIIERGFCLGTSPAPATNCIAEGATSTGAFTYQRTGLSQNTLYYYRAYATNAAGTAYSADGTFTTLAPSVCSVVGTPTHFNNAGINSALINKPTGVVTNDIMFAHILHTNNSDRLVSIPADWILIGRHRNGSSNQALYYKVATTTEAASYTFNFSANPPVGITISAYRGCFNPLNPVIASSNTQYVTSNTTYRASAITVPANTTVLFFPSVVTTTAATFANPLTQSGGWTEDYDSNSSVSGHARAVYRKMISAASSTGVIDSIGMTGTTIKHTFSVGLRPQ